MKWKVLSRVCIALAILLSQVMCGVTAYQWADMVCCITHRGCSAPASVALLSAIPFVLAIALCGALAGIFGKKARAL